MKTGTGLKFSVPVFIVSVCFGHKNQEYVPIRRIICELRGL